MLRLIAALIIFATPSVALADECAIFTDGRHIYDYSSGDVTITGEKNCKAEDVYFKNDITPDIVLSCDGVKVVLSFQNGIVYANENGKEEQLIEACSA